MLPTWDDYRKETIPVHDGEAVFSWPEFAALMDVLRPLGGPAGLGSDLSRLPKAVTIAADLGLATVSVEVKDRLTTYRLKVSGYELFRVPEYQSLRNRLGFPGHLAETGSTVRIAAGECVECTVTFQARQPVESGNPGPVRIWDSRKGEAPAPPDEALQESRNWWEEYKIESFVIKSVSDVVLPVSGSVAVSADGSNPPGIRDFPGLEDVNTFGHKGVQVTEFLHGGSLHWVRGVYDNVFRWQVELPSDFSGLPVGVHNPVFSNPLDGRPRSLLRIGLSALFDSYWGLK